MAAGHGCACAVLPVPLPAGIQVVGCYLPSHLPAPARPPCRLVTLESATLTERQTQALFGDIKALQRNMQDAVGQDAGSMVRGRACGQVRCGWQ